ncbi:hypothetical protein C4901_05685 [Acidiferrobacter sp. SPIII_3]|nr:hypothetical protein C4901_05685 [Acidiferrobacter sp. SPIII_3]
MGSTSVPLGAFARTDQAHAHVRHIHPPILARIVHALRYSRGEPQKPADSDALRLIKDLGR